MTDKMSPEARSALMASIRSKNTKPELLVRKGLFKLGYRYRLHAKYLPNKPDLVFPKAKKAIFVHGCFWHRHESCKIATIPSTRAEYWQEKFNRNVARDKSSQKTLKATGWKVLVIWECEIRKDLDKVLKKAIRFLGNKNVGFRN